MIGVQLYTVLYSISVQRHTVLYSVSVKRYTVLCSISLQRYTLGACRVYLTLFSVQYTVNGMYYIMYINSVIKSSVYIIHMV